MTTVEIILLVAGILCLIASFMIPDEKKKESKEESSVNRQPVQELTQAEQDKVRERINDIINEQLGDISEKTEAQLDKISNTKILELNEYADTVMNEINKNHNETVFLYDMLNEKAKEVKNTVKDVNNVKKEVDKAVSESAAAIENNTAEYAYTEEVKKEEKQSPEVKILSQNDELKKQAETKNKSADKADLDIENANSKNQKILKFYKEGLDNRTIAKQLGLGVGEVKLVVDLYKFTGIKLTVTENYMKLKYHLRGLGIGFILTTIILMISNLFVNNNNGNNHVSDNKETSGSVIAYTTQADENNSDKKDEKKTEHAKTESAKDSTKESASQGTTQTETLYSKEGNTVTVKFENVIYGTAAAELLYKAGVIDDENSFAFYLQNSGYDAIIRDGLYQINIGDSYENIAKIITKS